MNTNEVAAILEELIEALQVQAKELDKLITHVQQVSPRLGYKSEISAVSATLSKLRLQMRETVPPSGQEDS
jgi:hypothetical protein